MLGQSSGAYLSYASDSSIRENSASGGSTSALLISALESGEIDGAIVCKTFIEENKVRAHFIIARTRDEILSARGSKYVETKFLGEVLPLLHQNQGRFAVCGLPCDISNLTRWMAKDLSISSKVILKIAFLCGHNSRKELIDGVCEKMCSGTENTNLKDFTFRTGHWRGELSATFDNGKIIRKPFSYFSDYRNLYFFAERKCTACVDHFGYDSDISMGDVWLYSLKDCPIKHTGVLVRTKRAEVLFLAAVARGVLIAEDVPQEMILDGQTRIAPTHYNLSARAKAGRWLGVKLNDRQNIHVSFIKFFSAFLGLANMKLSESTRANLIFKIPRFLIRGYLLLKKGIESV